MKTIENFQVIKRDFEKKHLGKCGGEIETALVSKHFITLSKWLDG